MNYLLHCVTLVCCLTLPSVVSASPKKAAFTIEIGAAQSVVKIGKPLEISIRLRSVSQQDFLLVEVNNTGRAELNYQVSAKRADGSSLAGTRYGERVKKHEIDILSQKIQTVHMGDEIKEETDLNKLFVFDKPGTYTIEVTRVDPTNTGSAVASNSIKVRVNSE